MPPVTGMMNAYCAGSKSQQGASKLVATLARDTYHPFEVAHDAIETHTETRCFQFFGGSCPLHVDAEGVAREGLAHVERKSTEKQNELRNVSRCAYRIIIPNLPWEST